MSIEYSLQHLSQKQSIMQQRMTKADKRSQWFSICITSTYFIVMLSIILLSFPVLSVIEQDYYNGFYLSELSVTICTLVAVFLFLQGKIT